MADQGARGEDSGEGGGTSGVRSVRRHAIQVNTVFHFCWVAYPSSSLSSAWSGVVLMAMARSVDGDRRSFPAPAPPRLAD